MSDSALTLIIGAPFFLGAVVWAVGALVMVGKNRCHD